MTVSRRSVLGGVLALPLAPETYPDLNAILDWNDAERLLAARIERHPLVVTRFHCPTGRTMMAAMERLRAA